jgi:hypothetical protein
MYREATMNMISAVEDGISILSRRLEKNKDNVAKNLRESFTKMLETASETPRPNSSTQKAELQVKVLQKLRELEEAILRARERAPDEGIAGGEIVATCSRDKGNPTINGGTKIKVEEGIAEEEPRLYSNKEDQPGDETQYLGDEGQVRDSTTEEDQAEDEIPQPVDEGEEGDDIPNSDDEMQD